MWQPISRWRQVLLGLDLGPLRFERSKDAGLLRLDIKHGLVA
jgi:hypothetical protein